MYVHIFRHSQAICKRSTDASRTRRPTDINSNVYKYIQCMYIGILTGSKIKIKNFAHAHTNYINTQISI